jgi:hypothetical protein
LIWAHTAVPVGTVAVFQFPAVVQLCCVVALAPLPPRKVDTDWAEAVVGWKPIASVATAIAHVARRTDLISMSPCRETGSLK